MKGSFLWAFLNLDKNHYKEISFKQRKRVHRNGFWLLRPTDFHMSKGASRPGEVSSCRVKADDDSDSSQPSLGQWMTPFWKPP